MPLEEAARVEPRDSGFGRLFAECWFSLTMWERDEILLPRRMLLVELVVGVSSESIVWTIRNQVGKCLALT